MTAVAEKEAKTLLPYTLADLIEPESPLDDSSAPVAPSGTLIIDNGSWQCRAGYSPDTHAGRQALPSLVVDSMVHRYQSDPSSSSASLWAVGRQAPPRTTSSRSPFESGVVVHYTSMEHLLDNVLTRMAYSSELPVLMTECIGNPAYARNEMAELMFECYEVPALTFAADAPLAAYAVSSSSSSLPFPPPDRYTLVIHAGNAATHLLLHHPSSSTAGSKDGRPSTVIRRINYGGSTASEYLLHLMQAKYPTFPDKMTAGQARGALHRMCYFGDGNAAAYGEALSALLKEPVDEQAWASIDRILQFPSPLGPSSPAALDEAEQEAERQALANRRREQVERMRAAARAKKEQRLAEMEERVGQLQAELDDGFGEEDGEAREALQTAQEQLAAYRNKLAGIEEPPAIKVILTACSSSAQEAPDYSLLDVPDAELDDARKKEKRRLRLLKAGADARERARAEKAEQAKRVAEAQAAMDARRLADFDGWRADLYAERQKILAAARLGSKRALTDRRSQSSGGRRLKTLVQMGISADDKSDDDDHFGADDADWHVYLKEGVIDEDAELAMQERLAAIEAMLDEHDSSFGAVLAAEHRRSILDAFWHGPNTAASDEAAAAHQLHLSIERSRVCEPLFQPSIVGLEQAGLVECIVRDIIAPLSETERCNMQIVLTGGWSKQTGMLQRIESELRSWFPAGRFPGIAVYGGDPSLAAYAGAGLLAANHPELVRQAAITRSWYDEHGGQRLPHVDWFTNLQ